MKRLLNSIYNITFLTLVSIDFLLLGSIIYMENFSDLAYQKKTIEIYKEIVKSTGQVQDAVPMYIVENDQENAYTDGTKVVVYTGLIKNASSWDEIALVLGHEVAHVNLGHLGGLNTNKANEISVLEANADKMGALYMMKAGYDICKGREIYKRWLSNNGNYLGQSHPNYSYRYDELNVNCE